MDWETSDEDSAEQNPCHATIQETLRHIAEHSCIILTVARVMAKIAPSVDDLFRRTATDSQLQAPAGDEIRGAGILGHVMRVLISHVNHCCADFNTVRLSADRGDQWKWGSQLSREVMNTKIRSVNAQPFGLDGKVNRLQERVRRSSRFRVR